MAKTKSIKTQPKIKKKSSTIKPKINNEKYYIHISEPIQKIDGFSFLNLDTYLKKFKKNSSNDIFIGDLLEYFTQSETVGILNELVSRLNAGQKLYIQGVDSKSLAYSFATDQIDSGMFAMLLYNNGHKKTTFTFPNIKYILNNIDGIQIKNIKFINSINYYIECQKQ